MKIIKEVRGVRPKPCGSCVKGGIFVAKALTILPASSGDRCSPLLVWIILNRDEYKLRTAVSHRDISAERSGDHSKTQNSDLCQDQSFKL